MSFSITFAFSDLDGAEVCASFLELDSYLNIPQLSFLLQRSKMMEPLEIEDTLLENRKSSRNLKLRAYALQIQKILFSDKLEHYAYILFTVGFILIGIGLTTNFFVYTILFQKDALFYLHIICTYLSHNLLIRCSFYTVYGRIIGIATTFDASSTTERR